MWTTLADGWPKNLKIILHFLISICGVNSEPSLLPYVCVQVHSLSYMYMCIYLVSCDVRIWAAIEQRTQSKGQEEENQEIVHGFIH